MSTDGHTRSSERPGPDSLSSAMKRAVLAVIGLICLVLLLFYGSVESMVRVWANSATFGHGFLIPPIVIFLVWLRRESLAGLEPQPSLWGIAWIVGAALVWLVGQAAQANLFQHLGLVGLIQGVVLAVLGPAVSRRLMFPLGYMLFMVPFGEFAVRPLQGFTAEHTTTLLRWTGIPVLLENWVITIPGGAFLVAEACAGVRFLIASIALGVLIAGMFFQRWWKRIAFVALSIAVPIGANVVRAYGIVMIAHWSNFELAVGVDHLVYGFIFLSFVMGILIAIAYLMRDPAQRSPREKTATDRDADRQPVPAGGLRLVAISLLVAAVIGGVRAYEVKISAPSTIVVAGLRPPAVTGGWQQRNTSLVDADWRGRHPRADAEDLWHFHAGAGQEIALYVAYYSDEGRGKEMISSVNRLTPSDSVDVIETGRVTGWHADLPPPAYRILGHLGGRRVVWLWYSVDGEVVADPMQAKLLSLRAKLLGGSAPAALVAVSALVDSPDETEVVEDFLGATDLAQSMRSPGLLRLVRRGAAGSMEESP